MPYHYTWLIWNLILLGVWAAVYLSLGSRESRREMFVVSAWTSLLGLTEPLFVPEYWSPPSLFDLAARTGFDVESLLFSFGIGGIAVVLYEGLFPVRHEAVPAAERAHSRHRYHFFALLSGPAVFFTFIVFAPLNPIYDAMIASVIGTLATWYCRPDLKRKMVASAGLFTALYFAYFLVLLLMAPGYVEQVWNLGAISGIRLVGVPLEELGFAAGIGLLWSSIYEHAAWRRLKQRGYETART